MPHLSGDLLQTCLCGSCLVIVSTLRGHVIDLAILRAVFKCGIETCLLRLFQMTFTVTMLHELLRTQRAFPEPQAILQAAAIVQPCDTYKDTA